MDNSSYNGWSNYETWNMALWIDNDQGSYTEAREIADRAIQENDEAGAFNHDPKYDCAQMLRDWQDELMPELDASVWSDLLNAAFGEIDWVEIAEAIMEVDKESSASRQHYIDTGRYLYVGEAVYTTSV